MSAARDVSFTYTFFLSVLALAVSGLLWGLIESSIVDTIVAVDGWGAGRQVTKQMHLFVLDAWTWLPFVILVGLLVEMFVVSRVRGASASGNVVIRATTLVVLHAVMVIMALVYAESMAPLFDQAFENSVFTDALTNLGWLNIVELIRDIVFQYVPGLLLVAADAFYITAPIRRDVVGGIR